MRVTQVIGLVGGIKKGSTIIAAISTAVTPQRNGRLVVAAEQNRNYCMCRTRVSYKKVGDDWLCSVCNKPSKMYLERVIIPKAFLGTNYGAVVTGLDTFIGRIDARIEQELTSITTAYGLPAQFVKGMYEQARANRGKPSAD